jgi:streptogramin lyase
LEDLPMPRVFGGCRYSRGVRLMLLLLAMSGGAWAQFLSFTQYPIPTAHSSPGCIADGPDGALWFTENAELANNIGRVTTAGAFTEYPIPTFNSGASCIHAGPDGALWFTESNADKIGRITTAGAITEYTIPTPGSTPSGIKTGPDDALWFTEELGNKIGRITTSGGITEYPIPTAASYPVSIEPGPDGALWFTETAGDKIGRITTAGVITNEYPVPTAHSRPLSIKAGPDGALWFTESSANKIGRITTAGVITNEYPIPTKGAMPWGLTTGPDGALWFTEQAANQIGRITTAGVISEYAIPVLPGNPFSITTGPDNALWVTDGAANIILRAAIETQPLPLSIFTNPLLPGGWVGVSYSEILSATGGAPPYTWAVSSGSLPAGLTLNPDTGQITGTPAAAGPGSFTVQVTDSSQAMATEVFSLNIAANPIVQFPLPLVFRFGGITNGPDGALWFTETTASNVPDQVGRITTSGAISGDPIPSCDCPGPNAIVTGPDGALWFGYGSNVGQITTGGTVTEYPVPNAFNIDGIAAGPDGTLWFTDAAANYIGRITIAGAVTQYPVPAHVQGANGIDAIAAGSDGALWFTETVGYIGRITTMGVVTEFPVNAVPTAITAGPDGALWFTDNNGAIGRITTAGVVGEFPTPTVSSLSGITVGPDGALWFTESSANKIGRITIGGAISEYPIPNADIGSPGAITAGPDGALWFTEGGGENGGAIGRLLPAPALTAINPTSGAQGATLPVVLTGSSFAPGGTAVNVPAGIALSNLNVVSPNQLAVTFSIASSVATGPVNVSVTTSSGTSQSLAFTITPPPPPPALTSISPASGAQGTSVPVVLTGANFIAGPMIVATNFFDDYSQIVPFTSAPTQVDNGNLTLTATVYPDPTDPNSQWVDYNFQSVNSGPLAANPNGFWQVYFSNIPLTAPGTFTGIQYYWTVNGTAAPNITPISGLQPVVQNLINPSLGQAYGSIFQAGNPLSLFNVSAALNAYAASLQQGSMNPGAINGFHLAARNTGGTFGAVTVSVGNPGVSVGNVTLVSATQINAVLSIAGNAGLGAANVTVSNPLGTSAPPPAVTFTVLPPAPTLTAVSPNAGTVGTAVNVVLNGSNFLPGGTVVSVTGGVTASNVIVANSGRLSATFSIPATAAPGPVNVTVSTAGGTAGPVSFTINPAPRIPSTSLTPGKVGQAYSQGVSVSGGTPPYTWLETAGALPAGLSLDPASCTTGSPATTCLIVGTPSVYGTSNFTLKVADASGASASAQFTLTINPPVPTIISITPPAGAQGASVAVTISGTGFLPGATVLMSNPGVTVSSLAVASASQISATFTIASDATLGPETVYVATSGGTSLPALFTVLPPPPVLTAIAPSTGATGTSVSVTLTGNNFISGTTIAFGANGLTASRVTVIGPAQITATFVIASNAAVGPVSVTVTDSNGTSGPVTFTVTSLLLTSISPASGAPGASVPVTLTGVGFAAGAQVTSSSPGVTVGNVVVVSTTQITATLNISATATQGQIGISVSAGGVTSAPVTFTVGPPPPPTLTSISPPFGAQGTSVAVTLSGTGFAAGAQIAVGNPGVSVGSVVLVSASQITATFTIAPNAALGATTVAVNMPGGATGQVTFTVLAPLQLTSISPTSGAQGASIPVTLTGAGFAQGAQISVSNPGVTAGNIIVVGSTQITATFNIAGTAAVGSTPVTVTLAGTTSASVAFTVNPAGPTLTSISPASAPQGSSVAITLTGTNFASGATVTIANSGVTASGIAVVSATQITATLTTAASAAPGATTVTVNTSSGASGPVTFTVGPAVVFSITGLPSAVSPGQQIPFTVSIPQSYPQDLTGELTLQFTPGQSLPADPTIALAGGACVAGTCTVDFQIPAPQTSAAFSLQTGTVAGTLEFSIGNVTVGGTAVTLSTTPAFNASAPAQAPSIANVSIQPGSSAFNIVVTGFSNTREITEADFTFTPTSGSQLQTSTFSLTDAAAAFQTYYATDASIAVGSEFVYTQTFNLTTGAIGTLQSVTVTLKNTQGASSAVTTNF